MNSIMFNFLALFQLSMTYAPIYATPCCIHGPPGQAQPVVPGPAEPPRRAARGAGAAGDADDERRRDGGGGAEEEEGTTAGGTQW